MRFFSTVFLETALYTKSDFSVSEKIIYGEVCTPFMSPFIYCKIIALFCIGPNAQYRIANSQCLKKPLLNQLYAISDSHKTPTPTASYVKTSLNAQKHKDGVVGSDFAIIIYQLRFIGADCRLHSLWRIALH